MAWYTIIHHGTVHVPQYLFYFLGMQKPNNCSKIFCRCWVPIPVFRAQWSNLATASSAWIWSLPHWFNSILCWQCKFHQDCHKSNFSRADQTHGGWLPVYLPECLIWSYSSSSCLQPKVTTIFILTNWCFAYLHFNLRECRDGDHKHWSGPTCNILVTNVKRFHLRRWGYFQS